MKRLFIVGGLIVALALPMIVSAQMVGSLSSPTDTASADYGLLGQQWMQYMMGQNYEQYSQQMRQVGGDNFFKEMQEFMGKSLSQNKGYLTMPMMSFYGYGTSTSERGDWGNWFFSANNPMWNWGGHVSGWMWLFGIVLAAFAILAMVIPIAILVLIIVFVVKLIRSLKPKKRE